MRSQQGEIPSPHLFSVKSNLKHILLQLDHAILVSIEQTLRLLCVKLLERCGNVSWCESQWVRIVKQSGDRVRFTLENSYKITNQIENYQKSYLNKNQCLFTYKKHSRRMKNH